MLNEDDLKELISIVEMHINELNIDLHLSVDMLKEKELQRMLVNAKLLRNELFIALDETKEV